LAACSAFPDEEIYNRLRVLSEYADYLCTQVRRKERDNRKLQEVIKQFDSMNAQIRQLRKQWASCPGAICGAWFEDIGDREADHTKAARTYGEGVAHCPEWYQLWIKGAGAMLCDGVADSMLDELRQLPDKAPEKAMLLLRGIGAAWTRDVGKRGKLARQVFCWDGVLQRWEAGLKMLNTAWAGHPAYLRKLSELLNKVTSAR
jgi:hypothetical protein